MDKENEPTLAAGKSQDGLSVQDVKAFKNAMNFLPKHSASLLNQSLERVEEIDQLDDL